MKERNENRNTERLRAILQGLTDEHPNAMATSEDFPPSLWFRNPERTLLRLEAEAVKDARTALQEWNALFN